MIMLPEGQTQNLHNTKRKKTLANYCLFSLQDVAFIVHIRVARGRYSPGDEYGLSCTVFEIFEVEEHRDFEI